MCLINYCVINLISNKHSLLINLILVISTMSLSAIDCFVVFVLLVIMCQHEDANDQRLINKQTIDSRREK